MQDRVGPLSQGEKHERALILQRRVVPQLEER